MIDSSFLLRNFVYQKIIRVINSFIVHLNAACASFTERAKDTYLQINFHTLQKDRLTPLAKMKTGK